MPLARRKNLIFSIFFDIQITLLLLFLFHAASTNIFISNRLFRVQLKYKRRVYKMLNLDERQLRALHSRSNLRRLLECVNGGHVEKISKMCAKGLDPNFHCQETGETPLTIATNAKKPQKLLIALVNGGALLDYRTKDGSTALHRAVEKDCYEAVS